MAAKPHTDPARWLLTGGSGRVGRMLIRHWQAAPPQTQIVVQKRQQTGRENVLVWDPLLAPLPPYVGQIACLIAFAGVTPASRGALEDNAAIAQATLAAAHGAGIPRVLLTSSSAVYGIPTRKAAFTEKNPVAPMNAYAVAKARMEAVCDDWRARGLEVCVLRIGNVVGADSLFLNGAKATGEHPMRLDQFADGRGPRRSYIGPASLARVIETLAAATIPLPQVMNVAAPQPVDMADLAQAAGMPWVWQAAGQAAATQHITLDMTQLSGLHAFDPQESDPVEMVRQWQALKDH